MRNHHPYLAALIALALPACGGSSGSSNPAGAGGSTSQPAADAGPGDDAATKPAMAASELPRAPASSVPAATLAAVVDGDNAFAIDLYGKVRVDAADHNVVISPLSVSLALSMTYAGAQNATATEMAKALHWDAPGLDVHAGHNALTQALAGRPDDALHSAKEKASQAGEPEPSADDFRLHIVNSVWGDRSYAWEQPFLDTLATDYGTGVYLADFLHQFDAERLYINSWVSQETQNKINDLLPDGSLTDQTRMVLVDAMHLKLPWDGPFEKAATQQGDFTKADSSTVKADYMSQQSTFSYFEDANAQIVSLPLEGRQISLVVALPKGTLDSFESGLTAGYWKSAWQGRASRLVALQLPKFSFTSDSIRLKNAFESLGMVQAFDANAADFHGMCKTPPNGENLFIGDIFHKAMMAVDENGVEAAAATAVAMFGGSGGNPNPPQPVVMNVNKPFAVAIVDEPTGSVLFLGHITDPNDKGSQ